MLFINMMLPVMSSLDSNKKTKNLELDLVTQMQKQMNFPIASSSKKNN